MTAQVKASSNSTSFVSLAGGPVGLHDGCATLVVTDEMEGVCCSLPRIDQTCSGRKGGFGPASLSLFQLVDATSRLVMKDFCRSWQSPV